MTDDGYDELTSALRGFLDAVASAGPHDRARELAADLRAWSTRLGRVESERSQRVFGERFDLPGRGQTLTPLFQPSRVSATRAEGAVQFGEYFHGSNGAAHGGTVPLLFDEVFGHVVLARGPRARTAYLRTDFRAVTPVGRELQVRAWVDGVSGRKVFLAGDLRDGEVVCAEAQALFVVLRDGMP